MEVFGIAKAAALVFATASIAIGATPHPQRADYASIKQRVRTVAPLAKADFQSVKKLVEFRRKTRVVSLASYMLPVTIADPNGNTSAVTKILLDPTYIDPSHGPLEDDFVLDIRGVRATDSAKIYSSFGLCKWQSGKVRARCAVEGADSSYQMVVLLRRKTLRESRFVFRVTRRGFVVGDNDDGSGRPGIQARARGAALVNTPLLFN